MGQICLILGDSGVGKSASLRNFKKEEMLLFNTANKALPFKNDLASINLRKERGAVRYGVIQDYINLCIQKKKCKAFVVDDAQFLMSFELMERSAERGYEKFTEIAKNWSDLCDFIGSELADDIIVYFFMHTEYDSTNERYKSKTVGKMVDQYMSPEALSTIVLGAKCEDGEYFFTTKNNGHDTIKTPMGMFDKEKIDNDLKLVDTTIRNYYEWKDSFAE